MYKRLFMVLAILAGVLGRNAIGHAAGLEVEVRNTQAGPTLYVNGKPMTPTVLFVNLHDVADPVHTPLQLGEVETAGRHGVNLVSLTIGMPWPREGETADWAASVDHWIDMALNANPNALLIPRIPVTYPPDSWFKQHPDERMLYDDGTHGLPSVHSEVWRRDAARHLTSIGRTPGSEVWRPHTRLPSRAASIRENGFTIACGRGGQPASSRRHEVASAVF